MNKLISKLAYKADLYKLTQYNAFRSWREGFDYLLKITGIIVEIQSVESSSHAKKLVEIIKEHIHCNIQNPDKITHDYVSNMVHFNPSYVSRLFKRITNISISDYIVECKIARAKTLLMDSDEKIQDIADKLGYTSQSNFTRTFKKAVGITPGEYRHNKM